MKDITLPVTRHSHLTDEELVRLALNHQLPDDLVKELAKRLQSHLDKKPTS